MGNAPHVRFGSKADICSAQRHVRFTPESGHCETAYFLMQSFKKALLCEPLSFCSFACFRQATDFAALCSSCWVGLMFCATRSDFDVASDDELCALAGSPASPRAITKILADAKRRSMSVPPEEISNFATTVALSQIKLSSSMQSACPLYPQKRTLGGTIGMSALGQKQTFTE